MSGCVADSRLFMDATEMALAVVGTEAARMRPLVVGLGSAPSDETGTFFRVVTAVAKCGDALGGAEAVDAETVESSPVAFAVVAAAAGRCMTPGTESARDMAVADELLRAERFAGIWIKYPFEKSEKKNI